ncbi:glycosyl transferase [Paenibacillus sp. AK121]|uniref:macrolide family glycosyltransferase n=1 Tax=Paenibacillus sp. AK121 TaxID=2849670 RepID=UPI001C2320D7|nr:macrolide family glycosyltransferase [Paenibacillus sp. AK121]MBU9708714.1 glycosyl transferase [Paenibacillus sp. AK121]
MARVLVMITPAEGHVNPSLGLVKQLVDRGEEVDYVCSEEFGTRIQQTGVNLITYSFSVDAFIHNPVLKPAEYKHHYQFVNMIVKGLIEPIIPKVMKAIENKVYDYLIYDYLMGWGGKIIAERLGIPAVCTICSFAFVEPLGSDQGWDDNNIKVRELYDDTMKVVHQLAEEFQVSVPAMDELDSHSHSLKVVYTSRYFQPQAEKLDDSYIFAGPSIVPRKDAPSFPFEQLRALYPQVVYISLGTILNRDLEFYKLCFEAFRDLPVQFVLSSGQYAEMELLADNIPDNFMIKPYIPQLEMLQRVDAFITHGGMNSASEALYYNVPMVLVPMTSDQPIVANRVQELGAGIAVNKNELTPAILKAALVEVLNQAIYKQQAHVIGQSLRQAGGYTYAADAIMSRFSTIRK